MTLNIIFVLIILTHAQGFESIKKYGGQGPLAAPYWASLVIDNDYSIDYIWPGELVGPYPGRLLALAGVGLPHGLESALDQLGGAQR